MGKYIQVLNNDRGRLAFGFESPDGNYWQLADQMRINRNTAR